MSRVIHAGGTHMWTHRAPRCPDHSLDWFPMSVLKSNALGHLPQRLVLSLYVWLARGGTRVQPHRTFWGRSLTHCLYGQTVHRWLKRPHVTIWYTLNFDLVTDAASLGFPVLACHLATPWKLATSCNLGCQLARLLARNTCTWLVGCKVYIQYIMYMVWQTNGQTNCNTPRRRYRGWAK